jgi:predicted AAA+ superfamily ATPase
MLRSLAPIIKSDLRNKIVLLSGPRQSGKTTLALSIDNSPEYLNYDVPEDRYTIINRSWRKDANLLIFDELHKMPKWKLYLKGIYDQRGHKPPILVTGSARLDIAKRAGDSLAGRHLALRMHPLTAKELCEVAPDLYSFEKLLNVGGFPEPYLSQDPDFAPRWRRSHLDLILRQDLIDLEQVREINQMSTLVLLLRKRVGSTVSLNSLAIDLQVDFSTVKRWISILENLYIIFRVTPWSKNITRALTKAAKFYFYDNGQVLGDEGARYENLIACSLLREIHWEQDVKGREISLHFIRDREKTEIDFCVVENGKILQLIEAKWSDEKPSSAFKAFEYLKHSKLQATQVVGHQKTEKVTTRDYPFGVRVCSGPDWIRDLKL